MEASLRSYVEGLVPHGKGCAMASPPALVALAEKVLRALRAPAHLTAEDLASELTVRLLERVRAGKHPLGECRSVSRVLRHRLRQLAIEHAPSRRVLKELTGHVRRAQAEATRPLDFGRPQFIERDGRFIRAQIRAALAWAAGAHPDLPTDAAALARWLAREFDLLVELEPAPEDCDDWGCSEPGVNGLLLARALVQRLPPLTMRLLMMRLAGTPLREIASVLDCAISTAHAQSDRAERELAEALRALQASAADADQALELLAQVAGSTASDLRFRSVEQVLEMRHFPDHGPQ